MLEPEEAVGPPITQLTKAQRRVLGTLLEKGYTTPEVYPLTMKALVSGCNQKSNRHPLTEYTEDDLPEVLDQLRALGLVAVVHTETGRTERYRHYARKKFSVSEPQLAVLTELLLRGRQSIGDLRGRASRFVPIESLDELRQALRELMSHNYVQATGSLERRGVEIDHSFYEPGENKQLAWEHGDADSEEPREARPVSHSAPQPSRVPHSSEGSNAGAGLAALQQELRQVQEETRELRARYEGIESEMGRLSKLVDELVRDLRG